MNDMFYNAMTISIAVVERNLRSTPAQNENRETHKPTLWGNAKFAMLHQKIRDLGNE